MNFEKIILLIEDEPMEKEKMEEMLGYTFVIRRTGEDVKSVFNAYKESLWMVVIDDLVESALDILVRIRDINQSIPVYMMASTEAFKSMALELGATGFVDAPFDFDNYECVFEKHL